MIKNIKYIVLAAILLPALWTGGCGQSPAEPVQGKGSKTGAGEKYFPWRAVPPRLLEGARPFTWVGVPGNRARARFAGDGTVQAGSGSPGLFIWLYDCASEKAAYPGGPGTAASQLEGYLPIPRIRWPAGEGMEVEAELTALLSSDAPPQSEEDTFYFLRIKLFNPGGTRRKVKLMLGLTPFGLAGSSADYGTPGLDGGAVTAGGQSIVLLPRDPDFFGTCPSVKAPGGQAHEFSEVKLSGSRVGSSDSRLLALCGFDLDLKPASGEFAHAAPVAELNFVISAVPGSPFPGRDEIMDRYMKTRIFWMEESGLGRPSFLIPHRIYSDAFRGAVGTLLMAWEGAESRFGPGEMCLLDNLHDTAIAALALNRAGQFDAARGILAQMLILQKEDGGFMEKPGVSATPGGEGLALFALADHYRFTDDPNWLETVFPSAVRGAEHLAHLIEDRPGQGELYSDDLWAIHGFESIAYLVAAGGDQHLAGRLESLAGALKKNVEASIRKITEDNGLPCIPEGSNGQLRPENLPGLGAMLWPGPVLDRRSRLVHRSFDHYWKQFLAPEEGEHWRGPRFLAAGGEMAWPFIILRQPKRVFDLFGGLLAHPVIKGIYAWPEKGPEDPGGTGPAAVKDGQPSVRAAAAYVIAFRMLFIHEREDVLVVAQCIPEEWFEFMDALEVRDAPTYHGLVSYSIALRERQSELLLDTSAAPPKGFILSALIPSYEPEVVIDDQKVKADLNFPRRQEIPLPPGAQSVKVHW
jgi:hypothetical protein